MVERTLPTLDVDRYGTWRPEIEDPAPLTNSYAKARTRAGLRAELIPLAEQAGTSVPSVDADSQGFGAVEELVSAQGDAALAEFKRARNFIRSLRGTSSSHRQGGEQ